MSNVRKYTSLDDMIELARYAHRDQKDKAGLDYFQHPYRVMQSVQAQGGLPYVQMGAILHDVSEDTAFTTEILGKLGVPEPALEIVRLMDRHASKQTFEDAWNFRERSILNKDAFDEMLFGTDNYTDYYYAAIRANSGALMVKLADIADNTQEWRLSYLPAATQERLREKYRKAVLALTAPHAPIPAMPL